MKFKVFMAVWLLATIGIAHAGDRVIIKYKSNNGMANSSTNTTMFSQSGEQFSSRISSAKIKSLSKISNADITEFRDLNTGVYTIRLDKNFDETNMSVLLQNIRSNPNVEYAIEDKRLTQQQIPLINSKQWDMGFQSSSLNGSSSLWYGDDFSVAWQLIDGRGAKPGNNVIVAVVDTGYTPHPNFKSNLQSNSVGDYGYSFIQDCATAGTCTGANGSTTFIAPYPSGLDEGDFLLQSDITANGSLFAGCNVANKSSWHGTHVTGTIVGQGYSGISGVLGGAYGAKVLPVRVLGKCGGYTSDIIDGMSWATGNSSIVNPNLAKVINLSLGGSGACDSAMQDAIDGITGGANKAIIVVAAGNSAVDITNFNPSGCKNVLVVASKGPENKLAYYSNFGATNIIASGGDKSYDGSNGGIYSTLWSSTTSYQSPESGASGVYTSYQGTSMATPHVSAAVADIISLIEQNPAPQNQWNYTRIIQVLQNSADYSGWNNGNNCSISDPSQCTASGEMNVESAISYVLNTYNQLLEPNNNVLRFDTTTAVTQTITFMNNNANSVAPNTSEISGNFLISTNTCTGKTLNAKTSCIISISVDNKSLMNQAGFLRIKNSTGMPMATVNLYYSAETAVAEAVPPSATTNPFGGGCAMVQDANGDDMSLFALLGLLLAWFLVRLRNLRRKT